MLVPSFDFLRVLFCMIPDFLESCFSSNPFFPAKILSNANSIDTIDTMIEYYISIEAYERCARLVQIKESILDKETTV